MEQLTSENVLILNLLVGLVQHHVICEYHGVSGHFRIKESATLGL